MLFAARSAGAGGELADQFRRHGAVDFDTGLELEQADRIGGARAHNTVNVANVIAHAGQQLLGLEDEFLFGQRGEIAW